MYNPEHQVEASFFDFFPSEHFVAKRAASLHAPIAHFFGPESTSTIRVTRTEPTLLAQQIGLDERINNQGEPAGDRPVLNTLVAEVGWAFFQQLQWQKIIDYLVAPEPAL